MSITKIGIGAVDASNAKPGALENAAGSSANNSETFGHVTNEHEYTDKEGAHQVKSLGVHDHTRQLPFTPTFDFTICEAVGRNRETHEPLRAVKTFTQVGSKPYDHVARWIYSTARDATLGEMAAWLAAAASDPSRMIVRGAPADGLNLKRPQYRWLRARIGRNGQAIEPQIVSKPRAWVALDLDDVEVPAPLGNGDMLEEAAYYVREHLLPEEFHGVRCVATATASTGLRGPALARMRLFFLLDREVPDAKLKEWARATRNATDLPVDDAIFVSHQPIYTARPIFEDGLVDPVPVDRSVVILNGDTDYVAIKLDRYAVEYAKAVERIEIAHKTCGGSWRALMDKTVGSDGSFYKPLMSAIGLAVKSNDTVETVCDYVESLLADRADPARQKHYGSRWVTDAFFDLRRKDALKAAVREAEEREHAIVTEESVRELISAHTGAAAELAAAVISILASETGVLSSVTERDLLVAVDKKTGCGLQAITRDLKEARKRLAGEFAAAEIGGAVDGAIDSGTFVINPKDHTATARYFLHHNYIDTHGNYTIFYSSKKYYRFNGRFYVPVTDDSSVDSELWRFLDTNCRVKATDSKGLPTIEKVYPNIEARANLREGFRSIIQRHDMPEDPSWLDGRLDADAKLQLPVKNGLLNLRTRELAPLDAQFFTRSGVDYEFDPEATAPAWEGFLSSLFGADIDAVNFLEEMIGYFLTSDTRLHAIFALYGPPRSGRGTILRVIAALTESMALKSFNKLGGEFGFQAVIGKKVLAIPDLRVSDKVDVASINEMIFSISGEDRINIPQKHTVDFEGKLPTRVLFVLNDPQDFKDTTGAYTARLKGINLTKSFLGKEDRDLEKKLLAELPGILNRVAAALDRLYARGDFLQPESGKARLQAQSATSDKNVMFMDLCVVEPGAVEVSRALYDAYREFAAVAQVEKVLTPQGFGQSLLPRFGVGAAGEARADEVDVLRKQLLARRNSVPNLERARIYRGIRLRDDWREMLRDYSTIPF